VSERKEADALHALFAKRADALMGCTEGSEEEAELKEIADALDAYEAKRWPDGKVAGGKGLRGGIAQRGTGGRLYARAGARPIGGSHGATLGR
jgi:hypothetical protein